MSKGNLQPDSQKRAFRDRTPNRATYSNAGVADQELPKRARAPVRDKGHG